MQSSEMIRIEHTRKAADGISRGGVFEGFVEKSKKKKKKVPSSEKSAQTVHRTVAPLNPLTAYAKAGEQRRGFLAERQASVFIRIYSQNRDIFEKMKRIF